MWQCGPKQMLAVMSLVDRILINCWHVRLLPLPVVMHTIPYTLYCRSTEVKGNNPSNTSVTGSCERGGGRSSKT